MPEGNYHVKYHSRHHQHLQEQVRQRGRGNSEFFGEMPHIPAHPFVVDSIRQSC